MALKMLHTTPTECGVAMYTIFILIDSIVKDATYNYRLICDAIMQNESGLANINVKIAKQSR